MTITKTVIATYSLVGYHRWPNAPEPRKYLSSKHRHLFGLRLEVNVKDSDREIEFHDVVDWLQKQWTHGHDFGASSCEAIAEELIARFVADFGDDLAGGWVGAEVWEDGENGVAVKLWRK